MSSDAVVIGTLRVNIGKIMLRPEFILLLLQKGSSAMVLGNFQCQGSLLILVIVELLPSLLVVGVGGDNLSLVCCIFFLSPYLWETADRV